MSEAKSENMPCPYCESHDTLVTVSQFHCNSCDADIMDTGGHILSFMIEARNRAIPLKLEVITSVPKTNIDVERKRIETLLDGGVYESADIEIVDNE